MAPASAADLLDDVHPEVGGEPERLGVDALVVAVEALTERLQRHLRREQAGPVCDGTLVAEEPCIGAADDEARHQRGTGVGDLRGRGDRVPQRVADRRGRRRVRLDRADRHVVGEVAERLVQVRIDVGRRRARHGADVDFELHGVGDHVRLLPAVDDVRRERRVRVRMARACQGSGQRLQRRPDARRIEQRSAHIVGHRHRRHLRSPDLTDLRSRSVRGQPPHDLGRLDQRVVGAERHRPVAGRAADRQAAPGDPLFAGVDDDAVHVVTGRHLPTAHLGERVVAADRVPVLVAHPLGAPLAAGFLVGDAEVDERALRLPAAAGERTDGDGHRCGDVEHVHRAAAPHLGRTVRAREQLATERIA